MKTIVILAAFSLVVASGLTIPVRKFEDEYPRNSELRETEEETTPGEAYGYVYEKQGEIIQKV